ncbi:Hypothetical predicted protein, partial [Paramuricea clavata]
MEFALQNLSNVERNGPFPLQYWPWFEIGANMQLCLAGLRDVDRHVVNGEILGVSLQLEDVLQNGLPDDILGQSDDSSSVTSTSSTLKVKDRKQTSRSGSVMSNQADDIKAFKIDVLQPVYQQIALKKGIANDYAVSSTVSDDEPLATPPGTTDMELKIKQLVRLLENFECSMISDVIRKISREHTLVLTERGREDATLPTDLWKRPVMKETTTIEKPHLVENYVQSLMADHVENDDTITFPKTHFNLCLVKLASETMVRERSCFNGYAMYYENLLRHQHQLLYTKEQ